MMNEAIYWAFNSVIVCHTLAIKYVAPDIYRRLAIIWGNTVCYNDKYEHANLQDHSYILKDSWAQQFS